MNGKNERPREQIMNEQTTKTAQNIHVSRLKLKVYLPPFGSLQESFRTNQCNLMVSIHSLLGTESSKITHS